jgi:hypothetical protein
MDKLSAAKVAQVLEDASRALTDMAGERDKLASDLAELRTRVEAEKLASAMHDKGLRLDVEHDELATDLVKAAEDGRLPVIQEAVEMVAPNMGLTGSAVSNDVPGGGMDALTGFILGNVG